MTQLVVLEGYMEKSKGPHVSLLLVDGTTLTVSAKDIVKTAPIDTSSEPMTRLFINPEGDITISFKARELMNASRDPFGGTITKWLDDGGTISKSRDDLLQSRTITKNIDDGGTISKSRDDGY